jgi:hypothetical protein
MEHTRGRLLSVSVTTNKRVKRWSAQRSFRILSVVWSFPHYNPRVHLVVQILLNLCNHQPPRKVETVPKWRSWTKKVQGGCWLNGCCFPELLLAFCGNYQLKLMFSVYSSTSQQWSFHGPYSSESEKLKTANSEATKAHKLYLRICVDV